MDDLKIIKKKYGEQMMHLCRRLFPTLLETPGLLSRLMEKNFEPSRLLCEDLIENGKVDAFEKFIYSFVEVEKHDETLSTKTPQELLSDAGYILYECKTEEDIQAFMKYYAKGEELCTFHGGRLNSCNVFFAVKKNVAEIKRENFTAPKREDEYGTSVISIQFKKSRPNTLSIKNRYNHTVSNPDNTFNNNLDNIIPGLTESFQRQYGYDFCSSKFDFEIPGYVNVNGKYYKYNYEINNVYYCPNNIIIDNYTVIDEYSKEPERYIVMDYFIIDLKQKTIKTYNSRIKDSFTNEFKNIEKININKDGDNKKLEIVYDGGKKAEIVINKKNKMVEYHNHNLTEMEDGYLMRVNGLETVDTPNLLKMGNLCLKDAKYISKINAKNLMKIGNMCLRILGRLIELELPNLMEIGSNSLSIASCLEKIDAPNLKKTGANVLWQTNDLKEFDGPNLIEVEDSFLSEAYHLVRLSVPKLTHLPKSVLTEAPHLRSLDISSLVEMEDNCLKYTQKLNQFIAPNLTKMGAECLFLSGVRDFIAPNLTEIGRECFKYADILKYKDAYKEYEKEDEYIQDETVVEVEKSSISLRAKLSEILKNNLLKIKEFNKKMLEGGMRR